MHAAVTACLGIALTTTKRREEDRTNSDQGYYDGLIGSRILAFDWYQNQWPWRAYPGTAQSFKVPLLSQERVKLRTSSLAGTFTGCIWTNAH